MPPACPLRDVGDAQLLRDHDRPQGSLLVPCAAGWSRRGSAGFGS